MKVNMCARLRVLFIVSYIDSIHCSVATTNPETAPACENSIIAGVPAQPVDDPTFLPKAEYQCHNTITPFIVGGKESSIRQFPFYALLGYPKRGFPYQ